MYIYIPLCKPISVSSQGKPKVNARLYRAL